MKKKVSQIKNKVREIELIELVFPGAALIRDEEDKWKRVKSIKKVYDHTLSDLEGKGIYFNFINTSTDRSKIISILAAEAGLNPIDIGKIDKQYMIRGAQKYGLINLDPFQKNSKTETQNSISEPQSNYSVYDDPDIISCPYCMKDDIKFGATICSECRAIIKYSMKNTTGESATIISFFVMIPIIVVMLILLVFAGINPREIGFAPIIAIVLISLILGRFITTNVFGSGKNYQTYKFERPRSYFIGISQSD